MLIQLLMVDRIIKDTNKDESVQYEKHCPFCGEIRNKRDCECDYHISYCFMINDHAKQLSRISKSTQRGGTVRLLSTEPID